jgi:hypothetical protein
LLPATGLFAQEVIATQGTGQPLGIVLMKTSFSRIKSVVAAVLLMTAGVAHAAPLPEAPAAKPAVVNDGYLVLINYGGEQQMPPRFCAPGVTMRIDDACYKSNGFISKIEIPPVTAQDALDKAYGAGRAVVVGIALRHTDTIRKQVRRLLIKSPRSGDSSFRYTGKDNYL